MVAVLKEGQVGCGVGELCRKYGISEATSSHWKAKYAGMTVSGLRKLKALEEKNRRFKGIVADQALDIWAMKHKVWLDFIDPANRSRMRSGRVSSPGCAMSA